MLNSSFNCLNEVTIMLVLTPRCYNNFQSLTKFAKEVSEKELHRDNSRLRIKLKCFTFSPHIEPQTSNPQGRRKLLIITMTRHAQALRTSEIILQKNIVAFIHLVEQLSAVLLMLQVGQWSSEEVWQLSADLAVKRDNWFLR